MLSVSQKLRVGMRLAALVDMAVAVGGRGSSTSSGSSSQVSAGAGGSAKVVTIKVASLKGTQS
jgi:hypothetical protein